jgi:hypothetical protein
VNAVVARDVTWRRTRRPAFDFVLCVSEDLAVPGDAAQAAGLVRADLTGDQVSLDVYSRSLSSLPSRVARRIGA